MKRLLCTLMGHRWMVYAHVDPIVGLFVKRAEHAHPLSYFRHGYIGYAEDWLVHPTKVLSPLAGCCAICVRCHKRYDDTTPGEIVKELETPVEIR